MNIHGWYLLVIAISSALCFGLGYGKGIAKLRRMEREHILGPFASTLIRGRIK